MRRTLVTMVAASAALAAGCARPGEPTAERPAAPHSPATSADPAPGQDKGILVPDGYTGRYRAFGIVLENVSATGPKHPPQLCAGAAMSFPPQCSGLDVVNWSWADVPHESAQGATWGDYTLVVTLDRDQRKLTLTERPRVPSPPPSGAPGLGHRPEPNTPCPPPPAGWRPVDPSRATRDALHDAGRIARASDDFAGIWIDQNQKVITEQNANDPAKLILNVTYRANLALHEAELRQVWGGALCVSAAGRTEADLMRILNETSRLPGVRGGGVDALRNLVRLDVWVAWESRQRGFDSRDGRGAVRQDPVLEPIDLPSA